MEGPNLDTVKASKLYAHIIITTWLVLLNYLYCLIYGSLCSGSKSKWKRNERWNYNCTSCLRNSNNWNKNPLSGYLKTEIKETFYFSKIWCLTIISLIHSSLRRGLFPVIYDGSPSYTKSDIWTTRSLSFAFGTAWKSLHASKGTLRWRFLHTRITWRIWDGLYI